MGIDSASLTQKAHWQGAAKRYHRDIRKIPAQGRARKRAAVRWDGRSLRARRCANHTCSAHVL